VQLKESSRGSSGILGVKEIKKVHKIFWISSMVYDMGVLLSIIFCW